MDIKVDTPEALVAALGTIRAAADANGGKIGDMGTALETLTTGLQAQSAEVAKMRAHRALPTGEDVGLRQYVARDWHDTDSRAFAKTERGAVQMTRSVDPVSGVTWGLADDPNPQTDWQRGLQKAVTTRSLVRRIRGADGNSSPICDAAISRILQNGPDSISRIFADAATAAGIQGDSFFPDQAVPELERAVEFQSGFADMFEQHDIPAGALFRIPRRAGNLFPTLKAAATGNDPANAPLSEWASTNNLIEGVPQVVSTQFDREASEDAILAVIPETMTDIARAFQFADDNTIINGDTTGAQDDLANWDIRGIWTDNATLFGGTADHRRGYNGLRERAFTATSSLDMGALQTADGVKDLIGTMGANFYAKMATGDIVIAMSPEYFLNTALSFTDLKTWDSVGPNATILTGLLGGRSGPLPGQVGFMYGVPVVVTAFLSGDMNAAGVYDNVTTTKTGMLVLDKTRYQRWIRRGMRVETDVEVRNDTITLVARKKDVFRSKDPSTATNVAYGFNLDIT